MKKIIQTIKRRNFSFFAILMTFFMFCHTVWFIYTLCNFDEWIAVDEDINYFNVNWFKLVLFLFITPILLEGLLTLITYGVYEDFSNKNIVYICPLLLLTCIIIISLDFNDIIDTFIFFIPLVIVYALGIFIAKKLGAPPSKKEIEKGTGRLF
ncbi:MAG: hypothetical protein IJ269_04440 [Bacteroidales bacterium]|nr:hypothetical protein [Bacteroidales bacterium]